MKTIEQKLKEYIDEVYEDVYQDASPEEQEMQTKTDFKAGVAFAESWIDFNNEAPEIREKPYQIFVKKDRGEDSYYGVETIMSNSEYKSRFYTHWRPISRL
jgi:hypothetical protein